MLDLTINTLDDQNIYENVRDLDKRLVKFSNIKVIETGKIFEVFEYQYPYLYNFGSYKVSEGRDDLVKILRRDSIARAQTKVRRLVNANTFVYGYMPIFVTYTFKENLQDISIANKFFSAHIRALKKRLQIPLRYLAVPELQKRGAIHYHVVFFDLPYISGIKKIFEEKWEHGFLQVKAIRHVKNVGAYISKYFSKQWHTSRLKGQKSYFTSSQLFQPILHRSLDNVPNFSTMIEEHSQSYESSKFGKVIYKQYKLIT